MSLYNLAGLVSTRQELAFSPGRPKSLLSLVASSLTLPRFALGGAEGPALVTKSVLQDLLGTTACGYGNQFVAHHPAHALATS